MLVGNIETALLLLLLLLLLIIIIMVLLLLLFYTKMCSSLNVLVSGQKEFKMLYNFLVRENAYSPELISIPPLSTHLIFFYISGEEGKRGKWPRRRQRVR